MFRIYSLWHYPKLQWSKEAFIRIFPLFSHLYFASCAVATATVAWQGYRPRRTPWPLLATIVFYFLLLLLLYSSFFLFLSHFLSPVFSSVLIQSFSFSFVFLVCISCLYPYFFSFASSTSTFFTFTNPPFIFILFFAFLFHFSSYLNFFFFTFLTSSLSFLFTPLFRLLLKESIESMRRLKNQKRNWVESRINGLQQH